MQEGQGQSSSLRQRIGSLLQNLGGRGTSSRIEEACKPEQVSFLTEDILRVPDSSINLWLSLFLGAGA